MNIVITGASKGIGYELVSLFLAEGHRVFAVSRSDKKLKTLEAKYPGQLIISRFDLGVTLSMDKLVKTIRAEFRQVDILVNNAGILFNTPFQKTTHAQLDISIKVNFMAPYLLTQGLLPVLKKSSFPRIINISSIGGLQGTRKFAGLSSYTPVKSALISLTECLAEELQQTSVSVNCLALGAVQTEMLEKAFPGYKALVSAKEMAQFIYDFALNSARLFNGKTIPVANSVP